MKTKDLAPTVIVGAFHLYVEVSARRIETDAHFTPSRSSRMCALLMVTLPGGRSFRCSSLHAVTQLLDVRGFDDRAGGETRVGVDELSQSERQTRLIQRRPQFRYVDRFDDGAGSHRICVCRGTETAGGADGIHGGTQLLQVDGL